MGGFLFLQKLLLAHKLCLLCGEGLSVNQFIQEGIEKLLNPYVELGTKGIVPCDG